mgnify:FL=1
MCSFARKNLKISYSLDLYLKIKEFGIDSIKITSNDVFEIYEIFKHSISKIKKDYNPIFIEIDTYRYSPHVGPEENSNYRPKIELDFWLKNDCIDIAKNNMIKFGHKEEYFLKLYEETDKLIKNSIEESKKAKFPNYNYAINCNLQNTYHEVVKSFFQEGTTKFRPGQKESKLNPY